MGKRKEGDKSPRNSDNNRYDRSESFGDDEPNFSDDEDFVDDITDEGEAAKRGRRNTCVAAPVSTPGSKGKCRPPIFCRKIRPRRVDLLAGVPIVSLMSCFFAI